MANKTKRIPATFRNHAAVEDWSVARVPAHIPKYHVYLNAGWRFTAGKHADGYWGSFATVREFLEAKPRRFHFDVAPEGHAELMVSA